jgi:uncharacterized membrane protein YecN with MAPEG domain
MIRPRGWTVASRLAVSRGRAVITVTPIYAGLLALLFVVLSIRVIGTRRSAGVALGDGGDRMLLRRQRVHANFTEYVPLALVLLVIAELQGAPLLLLHGLGVALLTGRLVHAYGVSQDPERMALRVTGMAITFTVLIASAVFNLGGVALMAALSR